MKNFIPGNSLRNNRPGENLVSQRDQ